ncbi:MAG TPA: PAS domain S-box protein [Arsenicitalea sp.]|nr:PAS domain S-box protein [Arsenicitalea sp.]
MLRSSDERELLRHFIENAAVPTFLATADAVIVFANRALAELLGYPPGACVGMSFEQLLHPEDAVSAREQFDALVDDEVSGYRSEGRYRRQDGEAVWVLASGSVAPRQLHQPSHVIVQVVDIDKQKRAEAALAASERRWNFALESAGQGVWESDIVNNTVYYSPMWKRLRGFATDAVVDSAIDQWMKRVHPDDRERIRDIIHKQHSGEIKRNAFEYRERHTDGRYI